MAKGIKLVGKVDDVVDAFKGLTKAEKISIIGDGKLVTSFKNLKKIAKGTGLQVHHLVEKRFATKLGISADDILSIAIDKETHKKITKLMREYIPYDTIYSGFDDLTTTTATVQEVWDATRKVYTELGLTQYLEPLRQQLIKSGSASLITDWGTW